MAAKMRAVRVHAFGEPEVMKYEETDAPVLENPSQAVVRVHAAGLNPVDTYIRAGTYARKPALPYTPGADCSGVVLQVGAEVNNVKVGDRVFVAGTISGACAEQALCNASQLFPIPESISFEQGAALHVPYATAYRALVQRAEARAGDRVLVHGASGGVGVAAVQFAKSLGMVVIGTAGTEEGRQMVAEQGADLVLDHTTDSYLDELLSFTDGQGVDVVLEMLANKNLAKDMTVLAKGGRVAIIGSRGTIEVDPRQLMSKDSCVLGVALANTSVEDKARICSAIVAGLRSGALKPVVGRTYKMSDAPQAHIDIMALRACGKVVLVPDS